MQGADGARAIAMALSRRAGAAKAGNGACRARKVFKEIMVPSRSRYILLLRFVLSKAQIDQN